MLVFVEMGSVGFAFLLGIQALSVLNTLWDVSLELKSRAPLGGFPPYEYLLHTVIFLLHGAFIWAVIANWHWRCSLYTSTCWEWDTARSKRCQARL